MILKQNDLLSIRRQHENQKIVLTSGTFDLLHVGHLRYLKDVKKYGDIVVVMLSGDSRVKSRKGPKRPVIPEHDRAMMLDALSCVDYVFVDPAGNNPDDPLYAEIVNQLQPDAYVTDGPDPRLWQLMDKNKLIILPRSEGQGHASTSAIIDHIISLEY